MSAEVAVLAVALASSGVCSTLAVLYHLGVGEARFAAAQGWLEGRRRAAVYHRHRCHAHPTLTHRARAALARARTVRLRAADPAPTRPDITARTAH